METLIHWFNEVLTASVQLYFKQDTRYQSIDEIPVPDEGKKRLEVIYDPVNFDETVILMLGLMPHLSPQTLDIFFVNNKNFDRPYTEFGGWKGASHSGFLPTAETASFMLAGENMEKRNQVMKLFHRTHWFYTHNILYLDGQAEGEPFLSGRICITEEILHKFLFKIEYKPDYAPGFPAKRITTPLEWKDMVLDYNTSVQLEEINNWIKFHSVIMEKWALKRILKSGYRSLLYGPPGTGKTLAATLLGKKNNMDVYRVDLSMIVSKYIGETEKNLAHIFNLAENRNWILFFDEADALFGKRTDTQTSNDRHANQEIAYLLQRIEDFPGTVILSTNLRSNIDEAFSRRFQSIIYFPMPDEEIRKTLWNNMIPTDWLIHNRSGIIDTISTYELTGGAMTNVIRNCALQLVSSTNLQVSEQLLIMAVRREILKDGTLV